MGLRVLSPVMLILYSTATVLQYNDPDLYFWLPVYGMAALWSWMSWTGRRLPEPWVELFAGACLASAIYVGAKLPEGTLNYRQEELSETGGLLVTGIWALVLARLQRRARAGRAISGGKQHESS